MTRAGGIVLCGGRSSRMGRAKAWLPVGGETMLHRAVRVVGEAVGSVVVVAAVGQELPPLPGGVEVVRDEVEGRGPLAGLAAGLAALTGRADVAYLSACDAPLLSTAFVRRVIDRSRETQASAGVPVTGPGVDSFSTPHPSGRCAIPPTSPSRGEVKRAAAFYTSPLEGEVAPNGVRGGRGVDGQRGNALVAVPSGSRLIRGSLHPLAAAYQVDLLPLIRERLAAGKLALHALFDAVPTLFLEATDFADIDPHLDSLRNVNTPEEYEALGWPTVSDSRHPDGHSRRE